MQRTHLVAVLSSLSLLTLSSAAAAAPVLQTPMSLRRAQHVAEWFPGRGVVVTGGYVSTGDAASVEGFDAAANAWSPLASAPAGVWDAVSLRLADGRWLVLDALVGLIYDPAADVWSVMPALAETGRENHTLTLLPDGDVLVTGGLETPKTSLRFDPSAGALIGPQTLIQARSDHSATALADGRVLAAGGWRWGWLPAWDSEIKEPLAAADLYDPATDTWIPAAAMATPRERHGAVRLLSGEVLVAGGGSIDFTNEDPFFTTASAERYDPATNSWSAAASMSAARFDHTTTLLPSGRVLVAGGRGSGGVLASVEVYDPATDTWTSLPPMSQPRWLHAANFVPGHGVLITGGTVGSITAATDAVELYPLGQLAAGSACTIDDECASGACVAAVCEADDSGGDDDDPFDCNAESSGDWPAGVHVLGIAGFGLLGLRRRARVR